MQSNKLLSVRFTNNDLFYILFASRPADQVQVEMQHVEIAVTLQFQRTLSRLFVRCTKTHRDSPHVTSRHQATSQLGLGRTHRCEIHHSRAAGNFIPIFIVDASSILILEHALYFKL